MEERIAKATAELRATEAAVARTEAELRHASVTVVARDRSVKVTVGPQGELTGLEFLDGRYGNQEAKQLAAAILEAADRGRAQMAQQVVEAFEPLARSIPPVPGADGSSADWERIFGSLFSGGAADPGPYRSRGDRLRDEIDEDAEAERGR